MNEQPRTFHKTTITITVLSEGPYNPDSLSEISQDINDGECLNVGECSGKWEVASSEELSPVFMAYELEQQRSEPAFLLGEDHPVVTMDTIQRNAIRLSELFIQAGNETYQLSVDDIRSVDLAFPVVEGFETFCAGIYKQLTDKQMEPPTSRVKSERRIQCAKRIAYEIKQKFCP